MDDIKGVGGAVSHRVQIHFVSQIELQGQSIYSRLNLEFVAAIINAEVSASYCALLHGGLALPQSTFKAPVFEIAYEFDPKYRIVHESVFLT